MKAGESADGLADQIRSIIEAQLAERVAALDRRERELVAREEALQRREQALAAETPTPARAAPASLFQTPKPIPDDQSSADAHGPTFEARRSGYSAHARGQGKVHQLQAKLFQAQPAPAEASRPKETQTACNERCLLFQDMEVASSEVSSKPEAGRTEGGGAQASHVPLSQVDTESMGTASQIKDRFEQKAPAQNAAAGDENRRAVEQGTQGTGPRQHRHSAPPGKLRPKEESTRQGAEVSASSAGTANELKDMFEQKAQQARRDSDTPERKGTWKAVQNKLDLPNQEGSGFFRAHEAPFRRTVKTVGLGQPKERRSLQELLKADEMCQMAR
mmetsp:Transcript_62760/g.147166  ORF Transcript_62760/g.147166 Transcript_62760/m.147166 type:complete len:332 (+) Transcript_62760:33-1028(+)